MATRRPRPQLAAEQRAGATVSFAQYEALLGRYDVLVQHLVQLKREGFTLPTDAGTATPARELPAAVRKAISERSEPGTATARLLVSQAWEMLDAGIAADTVVADILAGEPAEL